MTGAAELHRMKAREIGKLVAVAVAAALAGAGLGVGLGGPAEDDDAGEPFAGVTIKRTATVRVAAGTTQASQTATAAPPAEARSPRVEILSARLGRPSPTTGHARVRVSVRVTGRGAQAIALRTPVLLTGASEVPLDPAARGAAGPLLGTLAAGSSAGGTLRFTLPAAAARELSASLVARLRVADRVVQVRLAPAAGG